MQVHAHTEKHIRIDNKKTMKTFGPLLLVLVSFLAVSHAAADDFDFFYFVLQWPGSYCGGAHSCCFPTTGKPAADFGIHGLWPNYNNGGYPSNCDPDNTFDISKISDLRRSMEEEWPTLACPRGDGLKFWSHEWSKHGTCSELVLDQHQYFQTALKLRNQINLLQVLQQSGIKPDGRFYVSDEIDVALRKGVGAEVGKECNDDGSGNMQLYQIYVCVDNTAAQVIDCPVMPQNSCSGRIVFPSF